jgi:hypothetical protein
MNHRFTSFKWLFIVVLLCITSVSFAQYQMEKLSRGLVAVRTGSNNYITWRWLGYEPYNITFNLFRDGTKVNATPLAITSYLDNGASATASYTIRAVMNGMELPASAAVTPWAQQYLKVPISAPAGGTTPDGVTYVYNANDASVADLDGDGELEIILKWDPSNSKDNANSGYTGYTYIDAYKMNGTRMWRINFEKNIRAGAHYLDFMVYDFDGDGKAEMMARTGDGTIDGTGGVIGTAGADYRNSSGYILTGPEYVTVFNGQTGKAMATKALYPPRGTVSDWGDSYGNRVDRFKACVAYLDGQRPSGVFTRGYYAKWGAEALDWRNGQLTTRWTYMCPNNSALSEFSEGAHSLSVADVDGDGKHEVITGSLILDDNGSIYYNTNNGHGDALHVSDLDPSIAGLEIFHIQEPVADAGAYMYSGKDKKVLWKKASVAGSSEGPGRGVSGDVSSKWAGAEAWVVGGGISGELMDCKGNFVSGQPVSGGSGFTCNFLVWWNGDLLREMLDATRIDNYDLGRIINLGTLTSVASNNGTKSTPCLSGDILGDWREEVMLRSSDNTSLVIFTTTIATTYKFRTLMHEPQYRTAIAWQNTGYNQPPHVGFFLGDGMTTPTKPNIAIIGGIAPSINLTSPLNNATFTSPVTVDLAATAVDPDGTISKVEFFNGTTLLTSDASSPYAYSWTNVAPGTYTITAVATDNSGLTTTSTQSVVIVNDLPRDCFGVAYGTATLDNCGRCILGTTGKTACTSAGEAEADACSFDGVTETKNTGYKGTSYLNVDNAVGTAITFNVSAAMAGTATISFRYANGGTVDRPAQISVNGTILPNTLSFPVTGTFTDWKTVDVSLSLLSGENVVKLISATAEGLANIDQIGYLSTSVSKGSCVITGFDESNQSQFISIYPNPSKSNFNMKTSQAINMQVIDVEGKLCEEHKNVSNVEFGENLKSGIYFLKIDNKVYKLVKE